MAMAHPDQDVEKCKDCKTVECLWKTVWLFLKQMVYLPYDPVMELLDTCYREMKKKENLCPQKTCREMFMAALPLTAENLGKI